jgi:hypothetical protein
MSDNRAQIVCVAGVQVAVLRRGRWWIVESLPDRECLSGGFPTRPEAVAEARNILAASTATR